MAQGISINIGLNFVDPNHYMGWDGELAACEFDANDMSALAKDKGFNTQTILTKDATRSQRHNRHHRGRAEAQIRRHLVFDVFRPWRASA